MSARVLDELRALRRRRRLVRFERRFEGVHQGFVAGIGPEWFLLSTIGDTIHFNGFEAHRARDVRRLRADDRQGFVETVCARRGLVRPRAPRVDLADVGAVLRSAGRRFPLVTIHRERRDPDVCHIGAVVDVDARAVTLHEIDPHGEWEDELDRYALREITRVDFGGGYEEALHLAGGDPPPVA